MCPLAATCDAPHRDHVSIFPTLVIGTLLHPFPQARSPENLCIFSLHRPCLVLLPGNFRTCSPFHFCNPSLNSVPHHFLPGPMGYCNGLLTCLFTSSSHIAPFWLLCCPQGNLSKRNTWWCTSQFFYWILAAFRAEFSPALPYWGKRYASFLNPRFLICEMVLVMAASWGGCER